MDCCGVGREDVLGRGADVLVLVTRRGAGVLVLFTRRGAGGFERCTAAFDRDVLLGFGGAVARGGLTDVAPLEGRVLVLRRPAFEGPVLWRGVLRAAFPPELLAPEEDAPGRLTCVGPALHAGALKLNTASNDAKIIV